MNNIEKYFMELKEWNECDISWQSEYRGLQQKLRELNTNIGFFDIMFKRNENKEAEIMKKINKMIFEVMSNRAKILDRAKSELSPFEFNVLLATYLAYKNGDRLL